VARRSPTNARYQKYQEPPGKTRKSAAAAKPSRKAVNPNAPTPGAASKRSRPPLDPPTPEFKQLRTRWWVLLLAGMVLVLFSWGMRAIDKPGGILSARFMLGSMDMTYAGLVAAFLLGLAYASIFYALYLDFARMRPMRKEFLESQSSKPAKPSKKDSTKA